MSSADTLSAGSGVAEQHEDRRAWAIAGVGVLVALLIPPVGAVIVWAGVGYAWVRPCSTRTRVVLTMIVVVLSLLVFLGWGWSSTGGGGSPAAPMPSP